MDQRGPLIWEFDILRVESSVPRGMMRFRGGNRAALIDKGEPFFHPTQPIYLLPSLPVSKSGLRLLLSAIVSSSAAVAFESDSTIIV